MHDTMQQSLGNYMTTISESKRSIIIYMQYIDVYIQHKYLPFLCVQILAIPWNRVVKQLLLIRVLNIKWV